MALQITTARQMRILLREENKKRKLAEKQRKANETVNPKVMYEIIESLKSSNSWFTSRYMLVYGKENEELIREVFNNFDAYKRSFRQLGYKLRYESDCYGSGFSISF